MFGKTLSITNRCRAALTIPVMTNLPISPSLHSVDRIEDRNITSTTKACPKLVSRPLISPLSPPPLELVPSVMSTISTSSRSTVKSVTSVPLDIPIPVTRVASFKNREVQQQQQQQQQHSNNNSTNLYDFSFTNNDGLQTNLGESTTENFSYANSEKYVNDVKYTKGKDENNESCISGIITPKFKAPRIGILDCPTFGSSEEIIQLRSPSPFHYGSYKARQPKETKEKKESNGDLSTIINSNQSQDDSKSWNCARLLGTLALTQATLMGVAVALDDFSPKHLPFNILKTINVIQNPTPQEKEDNKTKNLSQEVPSLYCCVLPFITSLTELHSFKITSLPLRLLRPMTSSSSFSSCFCSSCDSSHNSYNSSSKIALKTGACMIPHPDKVHKGGEDAYFLSPHIMGVADGVGGWAAMGIDSGIFSRELMSTCLRIAQRHAPNDNQNATTINKNNSNNNNENISDRISAVLSTNMRKIYPQELVSEGHAEIKKLKIPGSATVCVLSAYPNNAADRLDFSVANLGDSGFIIIGQNGSNNNNKNIFGLTPEQPFRYLSETHMETNKILHRSRAQQSAFNTPFQLSVDDKSNNAEDADLYNGSLKPGDIIIMGTDGLFDNLYDHEILEVFGHPQTVATATPGLLAKTIADLARTHAATAIPTPWYTELRKVYPDVLPCGKLDDITVIVSLVTN